MLRLRRRLVDRRAAAHVPATPGFQGLEELEPRLMMSGGPVGLAMGDADPGYYRVESVTNVYRGTAAWKNTDGYALTFTPGQDDWLPQEGQLPSSLQRYLSNPDPVWHFADSAEDAVRDAVKGQLRIVRLPGTDLTYTSFLDQAVGTIKNPQISPWAFGRVADLEAEHGGDFYKKEFGSQDLPDDAYVISIEDQAGRGGGDRDFDDFFVIVELQRHDQPTGNLVLNDLPEEGGDGDNEVDPGAFLWANVDDDDGNGVRDLEQAGPITFTDDLMPLNISLDWAHDGGLRLRTTNAQHVNLWASPDKSTPFEDHISLDENLELNLWIEGLSGSDSVGDVVFELVAGEGDEEAILDTAHLTVLDADLDIDSDDDNGFELPDRTAWEEVLEDSIIQPGKLVAATTGDIDGDGRVDFADVDGIAGGHYVPLILELPASLEATQWTDLTFTFDYEGSNPHHVTGSGAVDDPFRPDDGLLRIWTTDAPTAKDYITDWIAPDTPMSFDDLGVTPGPTNSVTLYVETVRPFTRPSSISVSVGVSGDAWSGTLTDRVVVSGTSGTLHFDANRDGVVRSNGSDATDRDNPFRFWVNNDLDRWDDVSEVAVDATTSTGASTDASTSTVGSFAGTGGDVEKIKFSVERDLEDFVRGGVWLEQTLGYHFGRIEFSLENASSNALAVRIHASAGTGQVPAGTLSATAHLLDATIHADTLTRVHSHNHPDHAKYRDVTTGAAASLSNAELWGNVMHGPSREPQTWRLEAVDEMDSQFIMPFLLEGVGEGSGDLVVRVFDRLGNVQATSRVQIEMHVVRDFYEHWTHLGALGDRKGNDDFDPKLGGIDLTRGIRQTADSGTQARQYAQDDEILVFVHGWRMDTEHRRQFAETAYKRLYWSGYRGTMALYSWPTLYHEGDLEDFWGDPGHFNKSEELAWHSSVGLHRLLTDKIHEYGSDNVNLIAHSMGGIVASEALNILERNDQKIHTAILTQAAVSAHFYNGSVPPRAVNIRHPRFHPAALGVRHRAPNGADYWYYHGLPNSGLDAIGGWLPRFSRIDKATTNLVNFYNAQDFALDAWEYNMEFARPYTLDSILTDPFPGFGKFKYEFDRLGTNKIERIGHDGTRTLLVPGVDAKTTYEIYAHAFSSISNAIGQVDPTTFPDGKAVFTGIVNLETLFRFGDASSDHSGQFYGAISEPKVRGYWGAVEVWLR